MEEAGLLLFINGKRHVVSHVRSCRTSLLSFLRDKLRLTGTKEVCGQGACGACTVTLSRWNPTLGKAEHIAVDACITKLCSLHGVAVTTVEGLGNTKGKGLHPVQERIYKAHGVQCGFCTPGMVMSMSTALRCQTSDPANGLPDIESIIQGNICRCTGYRAIMDGFATFDERKEKADNPTFDESTFAKYCPDDDDPAFPDELKSEEFHAKAICVATDEGDTWHRPVSIEQVREIFGKYGADNVKLVAGGTGGYKMESLPAAPNTHWVQTAAVRELQEVSETAEHVSMGAGITIKRVRDICKDIVKGKAKEKTAILQTLSDVLDGWVCTQISNVATLGGHLGWAHPSSDIIPILVASNCKANVLNMIDGTSKRISIKDAVLNRGTSDLITAVLLPFTKVNDFCHYFRKAMRKTMSLPIANAAFFGSVSAHGEIDSLTIAVGGTEVTFTASSPSMPMMMKEVTKCVLGRKPEAVDKDLLRQAVMNEVQVDIKSPGEQSRYRKCLVFTFAVRFLRELTRGTLSGFKAAEKIPVQSSLSFDVASPENNYSVQRTIPHAWGAELATGEARYVSDVGRYRDELILIPLLSEKPHARVLEVDYAEALEIDGVAGALTPDDVPDNWWGLAAQDEEVVARKPQFHGQVIGGLLCDDYHNGRKAIKLVKVKYEELPHVSFLEKSKEKVSNNIGFKSGSAALNGDEVTVRGSVTIGGQKHMYLEKQEALAVPSGEKDELTIFVGTQFPKGVQYAISKVLRIPKHKIIVKCKRVGGAFGAKERVQVPLLAAVAAKKFNRPCRIVQTEFEDDATSGNRPSWQLNYTATADRSGVIKDVKIGGRCNAGASHDLSPFISYNALSGSDGGYTWRSFEGTIEIMKTNSVPNTAFRGFGRPEGMYLAELVVEHVAAELGLDAMKVREANMTREGDKVHYGDTWIKGCTLEDCWKTLLEKSDFHSRSDEITSFNARSTVKKRGIAAIPMKFPMGLPRKGSNQGHCYVQVFTDGSVGLSHGGTEMGQGLHTKMMQVCATALGIPLELVHIVDTGTDSVANASPTVGSLGADFNGPAVVDACRQLNERLQPVKAKHPGKSWPELILEAYGDNVHLSAAGHYCNPEITMDIKTGKGVFCTYFTYGAGCVEVEVDCHTGEVSVARADVVMDLGRSLNPAIDVGQVEGAFVQGLGYVTTEQLLQSPTSGRFFTTGPADYLVPTAADVPRSFNVTLLPHGDGDAGRPTSACYSSKAVGEPPLVLAMAVPPAVRQALQSYRGTNEWINLDIPLTCDKVRMLAADQTTRAAEEAVQQIAKERKIANEV